MTVALVVNGTTYNYPQLGDIDWGSVATSWAQAVTGGMLQKAGGQFTLTANVDFGGNYGLISQYFTSRTSNSAASGSFRLAAIDQVTWRNNANSGDLGLGVDVNDRLTFNGGVLQAITVADTSTIDLNLSVGGEITGSIVAGSITNSMVNASAAIAYSKLNLSGSIVNADIATSAAISYSKLATLTASRALVSDGSGFVSASTATSTEVGYLSGVTSAIQNQLNAKLNLAGGTMTGTLLLAADPTLSLEAATKQYVDAAAQGLQAKTPAAVATTTNITLSGEQTIDGVLTSSSRVLVKNQTLQENNGVYVSAAGAWTRAPDLNTWAEFVQAYVFVTGGTSQAFSGWLCTAQSGGTLGTDPVVFNVFSQAGSITTDGQGIEITGVQLSLELDGSTLSKSASGLKVNQIANAQIAAAAAIAVNKLAAVTASRALVSDGSGFMTASSVTSTELGYLSGVTSAIQTQLGTKITDPMTTNGDLITRAAGVPARLAIGTSGYVLASNGSAPVWANPNVNAPTQAVSGNISLSSTDVNKYLFVDTSVARTIQLPAPAAGFSVVVKDSTGQAQANNITLLRHASEQIEGIAASKLLQTNWGSWRIISDGTNWFLV